MGLTHSNGRTPAGPSEHGKVAGPRLPGCSQLDLGAAPVSPCLLGPGRFAFLTPPPQTWRKVLRAGDEGCGQSTAKHPPLREQSCEGAHMLLPGEAGRRRSWGRAAPDSSHPGSRGPARSPATISLPGPETLSPPGPSASSQRSHARPVDHLQPAAAQHALDGLGHGGLQLSEPRTSETAGEMPPQEPRVLNAPSRVSWAVACPELQLSP